MKRGRAVVVRILEVIFTIHRSIQALGIGLSRKAMLILYYIRATDRSMYMVRQTDA